MIPLQCVRVHGTAEIKDTCLYVFLACIVSLRLQLLDSSDAVQRIVRAKVKTIGKSRAAAIKEAWDSRRGE